jgi:hypothetical protein
MEKSIIILNLEDIREAGFNIKNITKDQFNEIAYKMQDYLMLNFWEDLNQACDYVLNNKI